MTDLDALDLFTDPSPRPVIEREPRKCRRHVWVRVVVFHDLSSDEGPDEHTPPFCVCGNWWPCPDAPQSTEVRCSRCPAIRDETKARRGRQSRSYGNRAELAVARTYGGEKIGHAGGPVDVRGKDFNTQVKTHRRLPPLEWRKAFGAMAANRERLPRLLLRFLPGPGLPPDDYIVIPAKAWLDWFGRDE